MQDNRTIDEKIRHGMLARWITKRERELRRTRLPERVFNRIVDNYLDSLNI